MFTCMVFLVLAAPGEGLSADEFGRFMQSLHEPIKSMAFEYEGRLHWVASEALLKFDPERFGAQFQGKYLYRSDGSEAYDVYYKKHPADSPTNRRKLVLFKGKVSSSDFSEDRPKRSRRPASAKSGAVGSLYGPNSPLVLNYVSLFAWKSNPAQWGYKCHGWETVDSHRCLVVQLNLAPSPDPSTTHYTKYWVDMERGGHPLRVEDYRDGRLASRVDHVLLAQFDAPDKSKVWLPTHAESGGFDWNGTFYTYPLMNEKIALIGSSVLVNPKLEDSCFSLEGKGCLPVAEQGPNPLAESYAKQPKEKPAKVRTDPAGVKENVDRLIEKADAQARTVDASPVSAEDWDWSLAARVALVLAGLAALGGAILYKRKYA
ncbi:MAG: hypothetical protein ACP5XB_05830 [Isosphaeraceae bacterium]